MRDEPIITLVSGSGLRTVLEDACRDAEFAPRIVAETGQLGSLADLAAEGLGVAVMPLSATRGYELDVGVTPAGRAFSTLADEHYPRQR